ncbi:MAG: nitrogen fixation protein NifB [Desulforhopalus sp.]|jgi:nitrogen fixation protein NifB
MNVISLAEHKPLPALIAHCTVDSVINLSVAPRIVGRSRFSPSLPTNVETITVPEAIAMIHRVMDAPDTDITMAAISGPGDPLATPDITLHTIERIKELFPQLKVGIKTYGIDSKKLASSLANAGLDYVEMQVDAMRAELIEKLYAWIRPGQKTLKISDAAPLLISEQRHGVPALKFHEISVCIHTTLYPGYNTDRVGKIAREMGELGADAIALTPHTTRPDNDLLLASPTPEEIEKATEEASKYLQVVSPLLSSDDNRPEECEQDIKQDAVRPKPSPGRPNVAVVSTNGMEVDLHLGHASRFLIYGPREDGLTCLLETRDAPAPGSGKDRWLTVADTLADCFVLLVASAGETPRATLSEAGLNILTTDDAIEGIVDVLYGGGKKGKCKSK